MGCGLGQRLGLPTPYSGNQVDEKMLYSNDEQYATDQLSDKL